jgi:hypothetical protein
MKLLQLHSSADRDARSDDGDNLALGNLLPKIIKRSHHFGGPQPLQSGQFVDLSNLGGC